MNKRILCVLCCLIMTVNLSGCKSEPYNNVLIHDEQIMLDDSPTDLEKKFGNFYNEGSSDYDDNSITDVIVDSKSGNVQIERYKEYKDNILSIMIESNQATINNITIGSTINEVAQCFNIEQKEIGNYSGFFLFYDDKNNMLKFLIEPEDDNEDPGVMSDFTLKAYTKSGCEILYQLKKYDKAKEYFNDSSYIIYVYISEGKIEYLNLYNIDEFLTHFDYYSDLYDELCYW